MNRNTSFIINYLFTQRPEILDMIVFHTDRKSIIEFLPKLLNFDNYVTHTELFEKKRKEIISKMILKLGNDDFEVHKYKIKN